GRVVVTDFGLARAVGELLVSGERSAVRAPPHTDVDATLPARRAGPPRDSAKTLGALDSPLTATGAVLGTPAYMAPEQLTGNAADERADQFSFCVTLWEALAGARPFPGDSMPEIAAALAGGAPRDLNRIPRRLRRVLARGVAIEPAKRWPTIEALLAAVERAWRRPRRIAIACAAIATVLVGIAAFAILRGVHEWRPQIVDLPAFEE